VIGTLATFAALLAFLTITYAVHASHDVARRWLADRAEARRQQSGIDAERVDKIERRLGVVEQRSGEHQTALSGIVSRGRRL
jgi:hypothetical protein